MCLTPRVQPLCTVKHQELLKCVYGFLFMHICVLTFGGETLSWPVHTVTPCHCHGWGDANDRARRLNLSLSAWGKAGRLALVPPSSYLFSR